MKKSKKYDYFKAYEQLTELCVKESELLIKSLEEFTSASELSSTLDDAHEIEHKGDLINHKIFSSAAVDFMPPFDREDIVSLAHALDNVIDYTEDVMNHMYMYDIRVIPEDARKLAELIKKECEALHAAMDEFRNFKKSKKFKQLVVDINTCEEEADELYKNVVRKLHTTDDPDFMHVMVWSRIYGRMEKCCDACEHAADIMGTIVLKNM